MGSETQWVPDQGTRTALRNPNAILSPNDPLALNYINYKYWLTMVKFRKTLWLTSPRMMLKNLFQFLAGKLTYLSFWIKKLSQRMIFQGRIEFTEVCVNQFPTNPIQHTDLRIKVQYESESSVKYDEPVYLLFRFSVGNCPR